MSNVDQLDRVMNDLNISSGEKKSPYKDGLPLNIEQELEGLCISKDKDARAEKSKLEKGINFRPDSGGSHDRSHDIDKPENEGKSPGSSHVKTSADNGSDSKLDSTSDSKEVKISGGETTGRNSATLEVVKPDLCVDDLDAEKQLSMENRGPSQGVPVAHKPQEKPAWIGLERGPPHGIAVTHKPPQNEAFGTAYCNDDFTSPKRAEGDDEVNPPYKFRRNGQGPQEHEEEVKHSPESDDLWKNVTDDAFFQRVLATNYSAAPNPDLPDICPSIPKYDSDEFRRLRDDLMQGAKMLPLEGLAEEDQKILKVEVKEEESSSNEAIQQGDNPSSNNPLKSLENLFSPLDVKFDSGDIKVLLEGDLPMDSEEGTKVLSVTDLIEGNDGSEKMSPWSDFNGSSPGSGMVLSPYSNQTTPGSDALSSPGESGGDDVSRDSFTSAGKRNQKYLSTDDLPKPDISTLLIDESNRKMSPSTTNWTTVPGDKPKKPSKSKEKSARPRGRPRKKPSPDKPVSRPVVAIAPKPLLPQTTLIIVQNPGTLNNFNPSLSQTVSTTNAPIQANAPLHTTGPIQANRPLQANGPFQPNGPLQANGPQADNSPLQPNRPLPGNGQLPMNGPLYGNGPMQGNELLQGNRPSQTNGPLQGNRPLQCNGSLQGNGPMPPSVPMPSNALYPSPVSVTASVAMPATASLTATQSVAASQPCVNPSACLQSKPASVASPPSAQTTGTKTTAVRPESLLTEMLPSEKEKKNLRKAERLVEQVPESKFSQQDADGDTLLHFLSLYNRYDELMDYLFDDKSQSLFTMGIPQERFMFKALIEKMDSLGLLKSFINKRNKQNQTPLYLAVTTRKADLVHLLLERNADPNICAHSQFNGYTSGFRMPLHVAASRGKSHLQVLRLLLDSKHVDINANNSERKTALHCAVESHNPPDVDSQETTELLIKHKAQILPGPNEQTPLHMLIAKKDSKLLKFFLNLIPVSERKQVLNKKDSLGNTCLHTCAVLTEQKDASGKYLTCVTEMMKSLLKCEVDIGIVNQKNETAKKLVCKENEDVMSVYKTAENQRRTKRSQEKMRQQQQQQSAMMAGMPNMGHGPLNPAFQQMGPYPHLPYNMHQPLLRPSGSQHPQFPPETYLPPGISHAQNRLPTNPAMDSNQIFNPGQLPGGLPQHSRQAGFPGQRSMVSGTGHPVSSDRRLTGQISTTQQQQEPSCLYQPPYFPGKTNVSPSLPENTPQPQSNMQQSTPYSNKLVGMALSTSGPVSASQATNPSSYDLPIPAISTEIKQEDSLIPKDHTPTEGDIDSRFEDLERLVSMTANARLPIFDNATVPEDLTANRVCANGQISKANAPFEKHNIERQNVPLGSCSQSSANKKNTFLEQLVNGNSAATESSPKGAFLGPTENNCIPKQMVPNSCSENDALAHILALSQGQGSSCAVTSSPDYLLAGTQGHTIHNTAADNPARMTMDRLQFNSNIFGAQSGIQRDVLPNSGMEKPDQATVGGGGSGHTIPLHHKDFDMSQLQPPNAGSVPERSALNNIQFDVHQPEWMPTSYQAVPNM